MPTKAKRPSKVVAKKTSNGYKLLVLFLIFIIAIAIYLLADYSSPYLFNKNGNKASGQNQTISQNDINLLASAPVISSSESALGCEFSADRESVIYGSKVKLTWNCFNAEKCVFAGNEYGPINNNGISVQPEGSRKYNLLCVKGNISERYEKYINVYEFVMKEVKDEEDYKDAKNSAVPDIIERSLEINQ